MFARPAPDISPSPVFDATLFDRRRGHVEGMQETGDRGKGGLRKERVAEKWTGEEKKKLTPHGGECGVDTDAAKQRAE